MYRWTLRDQTYPSARWDHPPESSVDFPPSWDRQREPWRGGHPPNPRHRFQCHPRCCGTSGAPWIEVGVGSLEPLETRSAVTDRSRERYRGKGRRGDGDEPGIMWGQFGGERGQLGQRTIATVGVNVRRRMGITPRRDSEHRRKGWNSRELSR